METVYLLHIPASFNLIYEYVKPLPKKSVSVERLAALRRYP
jgi:hypothetical protein